MDNLIIEETNYTLKVSLDAESGVLDFSGASYPENAMEFFEPIINWLKEYLSDTETKVFLNLKLNYLNTSSTKCILDIIELLEQYYNNGRAAEVNWFYAKDDEDILETGEELAEDFNLPFHFTPF